MEAAILVILSAGLASFGTWLLQRDNRKHEAQRSAEAWRRERAHEREVEEARSTRLKAYRTRRAIEETILWGYDLRSATYGGNPPPLRELGPAHVEHLRTVTAGPDRALTELMSRYNEEHGSFVTDARSLYENGDAAGMRSLARNQGHFVELELEIMQRMEELGYPHFAD